MQKIFLMLSFFMLLSVCPSMAAGENDDLQKLVQLEEEIPEKHTIHNITNTKELKNKIIAIRDKAIKNQQFYKIKIDRAKEFIEALNAGEEKEETNTILGRDRTLFKEKKLIEKELEGSIASLKKSKIIELKAKDLLQKISTLNADTFSIFLFKEYPSIFFVETFDKAWIEAKSIDFSQKYPLLISIFIVTLAINGFLYLFGDTIYRYYVEHKPLKKNKVPHLNQTHIIVLISLLITAYGIYYITGTEEKSPHITALAFGFLSILATPFIHKILSVINRINYANVSEKHPAKPYNKIIKLLIYVSYMGMFGGCVAVLWGYIMLGAYLVLNISLTWVVLIAMRCIKLFFNEIVTSFYPNTEPKEDEEPHLLKAWLIFSIEILIGLSVAFSVTSIWGFTLQDYQDLYEEYKNGFHVGNTIIDPHSIIQAIIVFFGFFYVVKFIQWLFKERVFKYTNIKKSTAEATISLLGYSGIGLGTFTSLGVLGLKADDLTLVIGALSLGIGFGLQNVINNFVSGLILLFERPVTTGDWVILDNGLEGHIKRIKIRSTEIQTLARASVIIPNSDLISKSITNWTLHDSVGRIDIGVGVAYGSDTQKVKEILLDIAMNHPAIRKNPPARVVFSDFGDSSLNFELCCFARNIDDRVVIKSDIRFSIDEAFRKNKIEIPFPQRDLHLKSGFKETKKTKRKPSTKK